MAGGGPDNAGRAGGWRVAVELAPPKVNYWRSLRARPLPLDNRTGSVAASLIARGEVLRPPAGDVLSCRWGFAV